MSFGKKTMFKTVLPLVIALRVFSGFVAVAEGATPANSVALNTYGSLPVIVLNLTQSPINMNISTTSNAYGSTSLPLAIGLPGVYYSQGNGATAMLNNIVSPTSPVNGTTSASLMPAITSVATDSSTPITNYNFMSLFTVFPSWSQPANFNHVQYVSLGGLNASFGAAAVPGNYSVLAGYPNTDPKKANTSNVSAYALNAGQPVTTSINLNLLAAAGQLPGLSAGQPAATYKINIDSLGALTSGGVDIPQNGISILGAMHSVLNLVTDIATCASGDPLGIIDFIAGIPATIDGIVTTIVNANQSTNVNIATDNSAPASTSPVNVTTTTPYPAKTSGILVSATATFNDGNNETLAPYTGTTGSPFAGDAQSQIYAVTSATNPNLPLLQQNYIAVTTWRQSPDLNTGSVLPNAADTLFVTVMNEGMYTANQLQQYINNSSTVQTTGVAKYKPTKEHAQDTFKILGILTALYKNHPQDAKAIVEMFGMRGKYQTIKKDPNALRTLDTELKTIFEKYSKELPVVEQYLTKLAHK